MFLNLKTPKKSNMRLESFFCFGWILGFRMVFYVFMAMCWFNNVSRVFSRCFGLKISWNEFFSKKKAKDLIFSSTILVGLRGNEVSIFFNAWGSLNISPRGGHWLIGSGARPSLILFLKNRFLKKHNALVDIFFQINIGFMF